MDLPSMNALRAFEAAARLGSVSRAAIELNLTRSAISHQLRFLERENHCTLGQAALQWVLRVPQIVSVLPNIYDADQVDEFAAAPDQIPVTETQAARVEQLFEDNWGLPRTEVQPMASSHTQPAKAGTGAAS